MSKKIKTNFVFPSAGVYSSIANRNWSNDVEIRRNGCDDEAIDDITEQLVHGDVGSRLKVVLGCGIREFLDMTMVDEEGFAGSRSDRKNLIDEWLNNADHRDVHKRFVWNKVTKLTFEVILPYNGILLIRPN